MAYRKITKFTRVDMSQWPFWAEELQNTSYETEATAFLNWVSERSDVTFSFGFESSEVGGETINTVANATLSFDDEPTYTAWNSARESAGHGDYLSNPEVVSYCADNNITITYSTESD
jgi:hypothetical protein